ncbi:hypothetical protein BRX36_19615 [Sphingomonas sp. S-NIH.Pt1_0416]|uniref:glycosyltransferase family 4 protein n=1 Tax=Sphingomonas sp. S-NIH.Pt1_0416 TaxID=1920123 RepID=UPI000F7D95C4|nr:glycosyltransferase family 4 protein [Sphingomonas sp. S-NIH.Pt1_0416]RSU59101.1 hypothetical protein BRX36_19615 [Sphingomonas sp. S-NIH.Pt1_0416]
MRFLLLNPFDAYAGSQRIGLDVLAALKAAGHSVRVKLGFGGNGFLSDLPDVVPDMRTGHIRLRKVLYPFWSLLKMVPVALHVLRGDMVWANTVYAVPPALLAALLRPKRVIIHLHEVTFPRIFQPLLRLLSRKGVCLVCVSFDHARRIGLPATVLYNPVGLPALPIDNQQDRVLFVGTTQPSKGFALFVAVCRQLAEHPLRRVAYLSDETRHDPELVADAQAAGVEVVFGESDPSILYRDGFLLLQASDPALCIETFSLVAVEAMAWQVPVAGAGSSVFSEVLSDAMAFNAISRDPASIGDAIKALYADPVRHDALRAACVHRRSMFSENAFSQKIGDIIQQLDVGV